MRALYRDGRADRRRVRRDYRTLRDRIEAFLALPLADLQRDRGRFKAELDRIGDMSC
jgi:hypothetical protein